MHDVEPWHLRQASENKIRNTRTILHQKASTILRVAITWSVTIFFPHPQILKNKIRVQWSSREDFLLFEVKLLLTTGYQDNHRIIES